jgi:3-phosphoshikimate 1-carboxyvinyltransferase
MHQEIIEIKSLNLPFIRKVDLPGSKSISNRVVLLAALAEGTSFFKNFLFSDDTEAMIEGLKALGIKIKANPLLREVMVYGCGGKFPNLTAEIFTRDSGTMTRFLIPVLAAQEEGAFTVRASERMSIRPLKELLKALEKLGAKINYHEKDYSMPLTIHACGLKGGEIKISLEESTQFLSGLLMASPLFKSPVILRTVIENIKNIEDADSVATAENAEKKLEDLEDKKGERDFPKSLISTHNESYVKMSVKIMQKFGADIDIQASSSSKSRGLLVLPGKYKNQENFYIEPDLSTASYFFAAAVITGGEVEVLNIPQDSMQGDIQFLDALKKMGAEIIRCSSSIIVKGPRVPQDLKGIFIHMRHFSDTFMTLAAVACFASSPTEIRGIAHTRLQESDRIEAMALGLRALGADIEIFDDGLKIYPKTLHAGLVDSFNDHRIAMSLALIGLRVPGVRILNPGCVKKTCPDYFERLFSI